MYRRKRKKNILLNGWVLVVVISITLLIGMCNSNVGDKIITPENPEEEDTPDPKFNASDWILYSK